MSTQKYGYKSPEKFIKFKSNNCGFRIISNCQTALNRRGIQQKNKHVIPRKCAKPCDFGGSAKLPIPTHIAAAA
jgi:hypothetical protein